MNNIFVSSTCYDLVDLRAELEQALKNMGLTPIMSDRLTSEFEVQTDKNSIETCLVNLRRCDVVLLILSQRYGPSLEKAGFEDFSATHLEYKEAVKVGKPIFLYVRDRTEADYNIFKVNKNPEDLRWVNKNDVRIFEIFDEHRKLTNGDMNNWYFPFSDVTDLKERIQIDLKKNSDVAILNQITKNGLAPCVILSSYDCRLVPNSNMLTLHIKSKNIGNSVAIEPFVILYNIQDYENAVNIGEQPTIDDDQVRTISTLMSSDEAQSDFTIELTTEQIQNRRIELMIENAYAMITGHYLSDNTIIAITWDNNMEITEKHKHYESKKYFHANAIKHLTLG